MKEFKVTAFYTHPSWQGGFKEAYPCGNITAETRDEAISKAKELLYNSGYNWTSETISKFTFKVLTIRTK